MMTIPGTLPPFLVGREREQAILRDCLAAALAGQGSLVLIGDEAGIGKTALAESMCDVATTQGALVLIGRCYDLTETPPYGPWVELFGRYRQENGPSLPTAFAHRGTVGEVTSQSVLFQQVQDFLIALSAQYPTVVLLDDLHWADPASLDLLRVIARLLSTLPLLIIVTYRSNELTRRHPLYALLPLLVHESQAERLDLRPLTENDLRELLGTRYRLGPADTSRLIIYLHERAEGNPFFLGELLRTLEEEGTLRATDGGWILGDLARIRVPPLLRQVIDGRLARLGEDAQGLLDVAAVIGQEVPLMLWASVTDMSDKALLPVIERAVAAHVLIESPDGFNVRFAHALIREAMYEGISPAMRRLLHRRIAELLAAQSHPDPDAVAIHFQRAGDHRAVEWLVQAGERAHLAYAWRTAVMRYEAALALMDVEGGATSQRAWLLHNLAFVCRTSDPQQSRMYTEEMTRIAEEVGEYGLAGVGHFRHGQYRYAVGEVAAGLTEMASAIELLESLSPDETARMQQARSRTSSSVGTPYGVFMFYLTGAGYYAETLAMMKQYPGAHAHPRAGQRARRLTLRRRLQCIGARACRDGTRRGGPGGLCTVPRRLPRR